MLLSAICKMSANSRNRKRCGVLIDFTNVRRLALVPTNDEVYFSK